MTGGAAVAAVGFLVVVVVVVVADVVVVVVAAVVVVVVVVVERLRLCGWDPPDLRCGCLMLGSRGGSVPRGRQMPGSDWLLVTLGA